MFNNLDSLWEFRKKCGTWDNPIMKMGGCNLRKEEMDKGLRYGGIKMSDPEGKIMGSFDIRDGIMTYSPIFPPFYQERDLIKFANDIYFTTMKFEEIMMQQLNHVSDFYVHIGYYETVKELVKNGRYKLEKVSKDQMVDFINIPEEGEKIYKKNLI